MPRSKEKKHVYYLKHKEEWIAKARTRHIQQTKLLQEYVNEVKKSPCQDCGNSFPPFVMEFDHVRGMKSNTVSQGVCRGWSLARLQEEISKCDLVCSNCHRIRTFETKTSRYSKPWTNNNVFTKRFVPAAE